MDERADPGRDLEESQDASKPEVDADHRRLKPPISGGG